MENYGNSDGAYNDNRGQQPPTLRRPLRSTNDNNQVSEIVKNSVLSAEAAEFVPKGMSAPAAATLSTYVPRHSVQERLTIARQAENVPQAMLQRHHHQPYIAQTIPVHQHQHQHAHYQYTEPTHAVDHIGYHNVSYPTYNQPHIMQDYGQYDGGSGDYTDKHLEEEPTSEIMSTMVQLENAMRTLTINPGKFDSLVAHLVDTISPFLDQPEQCQEIFDIILQQSICEGNFRYSGARLCTHLDTVTVAPDRQTSVFRDILINQCHLKTEEQCQTWRQITKHTEDDEKKCHGLIFFLAELVTQMEPVPASQLGKQLIRLISTVLQNPAPTSVKNICSALKLAGQTLERDNNSGNRSDMEQVMRMLSDLVIQKPTDSNVKHMVNSVSELRSGNWGRIASNHVGLAPDNNQTTSYPMANDPVLYGPDGQQLTEEESKFLEEYATDEYRNSTPWEIDEDDMIAEAYEEFLKNKPNSTLKENEKNSSIQAVHNNINQ